MLLLPVKPAAAQPSARFCALERGQGRYPPGCPPRASQRPTRTTAPNRPRRNRPAVEPSATVRDRAAPDTEAAAAAGSIRRLGGPEYADLLRTHYACSDYDPARNDCAWHLSGRVENGVFVWAAQQSYTVSDPQRDMARFGLAFPPVTMVVVNYLSYDIFPDRLCTSAAQPYLNRERVVMQGAGGRVQELSGPALESWRAAEPDIAGPAPGCWSTMLEQRGERHILHEVGPNGSITRSLDLVPQARSPGLRRRGTR